MLMPPLTDDAAVELICICLGLRTKYGGSLVKSNLRDFVVNVSIKMPLFVQECVEHLLRDGAVRIQDGECLVEDLGAVDIAEWVQTCMVAGTVAQLESLGSLAEHVMKCASVLDGPFSALDLAAVSRVMFGKVRPILGFHDQAKLLTACRRLVRTGYLKQEYQPMEGAGDRVAAYLPRWSVANTLFRKLARSKLLSSQLRTIKRTVLMERALNFRLPGRLSASSQEEALSRLPADEFVGSRPDAPPLPLANLQACDGQEAADVLNAACALGNASVVRELLRAHEGLDVGRLCDSAGLTPLHFACSSGKTEIIHLLVERKAQAGVVSASGQTPVHVAAVRGHLEVVQYLCEAHRALATHGQDQLEFWDRELPEILDEGDLPPPLSPSHHYGFGAEFDQLQVRRDAVRAWIADRCQIPSAEFVSEVPASRDTSKEVTAAAGVSVRRPSITSQNSSASMAASDHDSPTVTRVRKRRPSLLSKRSGNTTRSGGSYKSGRSGEMLAARGHKRHMTGQSTGSRAFQMAKNATWRAKVRGVVRGKVVLFTLLFCLVLALYLPDLWVSLGVPSSLGADMILTVVMLLFLTELVLLSVVDTSYPLSFFFWMDCLGTVSMLSDISFLLGPDASEPNRATTSNNDLTLLRASRMAKIGARAGRLSRLVKLMRVLPGSSRVDDGTSEKDKLKQISNLLTNVLSKRVACMTIILVVAMPLFHLDLYPGGDHSLKVWVEAIRRRAEEAAGGGPAAAAAFAEALDQLAAFYATQEYGPYRVCIDRPGTTIDGCHDLAARGSRSARNAAQSAESCYATGVET